MTKVKLLKPWARFKAGDRAEFFGGVATMLISRGFAELDAGRKTTKRPARAKGAKRGPDTNRRTND